jgi:hypothetical protein
MYLRERKSWFILSGAERGAGEEEIFASSRTWPIECYLFDFFGVTVRSRQQLPFLEVPNQHEQIADGFAIVKNQSGNMDLIATNGEVEARSLRGMVGTTDLVVLSHLLPAAVEEIETTYLDLNGRPLFPVEMIHC